MGVRWRLGVASADAAAVGVRWRLGGASADAAAVGVRWRLGRSSANSYRIFPFDGVFTLCFVMERGGVIFHGFDELHSTPLAISFAQRLARLFWEGAERVTIRLGFGSSHEPALLPSSQVWLVWCPHCELSFLDVKLEAPRQGVCWVAFR